MITRTEDLEPGHENDGWIKRKLKPTVRYAVNDVRADIYQFRRAFRERIERRESFDETLEKFWDEMGRFAPFSAIRDEIAKSLIYTGLMILAVLQVNRFNEGNELASVSCIRDAVNEYPGGAAAFFNDPENNILMSLCGFDDLTPFSIIDAYHALASESFADCVEGEMKSSPVKKPLDSKRAEVCYPSTRHFIDEEGVIQSSLREKYKNNVRLIMASHGKGH